ncbi:hypothetical protein TRAPUB_7769 [Trametes pubescens]|uniref:J domain-containing protein n=1 Tax=Trametes pubescens TaxID=154538 RepID=A0A1M2V2A2_TRAPU|nr:hypothetical protein TRAPUB_7769 [Trametes pubescens]
MSSLGYLAFPPLSSLPSRSTVPEGLPSQHDGNHTPSAATETSRDAEQRAHASEERRRREDVQRQRRVEAQMEMALQGELDYVRMGLSVRDRHGRIDKARTEYLRAEIRRRDTHARVIKQWDTYKTRWKVLLASNTPLAFADIPWPVAHQPSSALDLQPEAVVLFFTESLQATGIATTEADRLRSALLRWHPDKMSTVLARTVATDVDSVSEGVNIVFRALHARIHHVKDTAAAS